MNVKSISINSLKNGMKLLDTIFDKEGRVLLGSDNIITEKNIVKVLRFCESPYQKVKVEVIGISQSKKNSKNLDRINDNIKKKFAPYAGEKFYDDVKDISLKITEYLISENSRLYD